MDNDDLTARLKTENEHLKNEVARLKAENERVKSRFGNLCDKYYKVTSDPQYETKRPRAYGVLDIDQVND